MKSVLGLEVRGLKIISSLILILILLLSVVTFANVDKVIVAVIGSNESLARSIEQSLSGIVSGFLNESDKKMLIRQRKECEMGLAECVDTGKFPQLDFVIEAGTSVRILSVEKGEVDALPDHISRDPDAIAEYFEDFDMYFHLPEFYDPQAKYGDVYVLMDKDFKDVGKCVYHGSGKYVNLEECKVKGAMYARRERRKVRFEGYEKELSRSDVRTIWIHAKRFEVYKDGQNVEIPVRISRGGYMVIVDIYGGKAVVVDVKPVEKGTTTFEFEAYYDPSVKSEELVFVLMNPESTVPKPEKLLSVSEFKKLVESSSGVGVFCFTVEGGD